MRILAHSALRPLFLLAVASACGDAGSESRPSGWALINGAVVDVAAGPGHPGYAVHIDGSRIVSVGASDSIPLPARLVDISGAYVLPGLADMHVHVGDRGPMRYLASGVTTVRDMGSRLGAFSAQDRDDPLVPGPRIWFTGPVLSGAGGDLGTAGSRLIRGRDDAAAIIDSLVSAGVDYVKVNDWVDEQTYLTLADLSRSRGLSLVGHLPWEISIDEAINAGQTSIEHLGGPGLGMLRACSRSGPGLQAGLEAASRQIVSPAAAGTVARSILARDVLQSLLDGYDPALCGEVAARLAAANVWQVPTLVVDRYGLSRFVPDRTTRDRVMQVLAEIVSVMNDSGVPLLAGLDEAPGAVIQDELEALVEAGLSPQEALRIGTVDAARFLNATDDYGSVAPGRMADLIVVSGDPTVDIRYLRDIRWVIMRGQLQDHTALEAWATAGR